MDLSNMPPDISQWIKVSLSCKFFKCYWRVENRLQSYVKLYRWWSEYGVEYHQIIPLSNENIVFLFRLLSHEANQHPIELSQCRHCQQGGFTSKLDLIMHESHNHTKKFACSVCQFRDKSVLACRSHYREAHPDKPLYCHQCQNYFENIIHVHHHLLSHHDNLVGKIQDGQQEFICLLCQKESTTGER